MGKGGGGGGPPAQQTVTQTNLPEYAKPYFENIMQRAQAESYRPYQAYGGQRIAGFTPAQQATQAETAGLRSPQQLSDASNIAAQSALQASQAGQQFAPGQFSTIMAQGPQLMQYQMGPAMGVSSQQVNAPTMAASQTGFSPQLERFQMTAPERFSSTAAQQYMSPYVQNVVDVQKREAIRDAQKAQLAQNLGAARQGTYGGARQLLATTERERALGTQLGDIQARGLQAAYEQAGTQFERDRAAQMAAQQANLQAALGVQQLGTQTGLQTALANLDKSQQAAVQNQAAQLQTQGLTSEQALRAALANQQAGLTVGQQNLQALLGTQQLGAQQNLQAQLANQQQMLEAQRMAEQSRQFRGTLGLQGLQQSIAGAQALGQLGTAQQQANLQRIQAQAAAGAEQRAYQQQLADQAYADFMRQRDYPMEQLGYYSNLLRGIPVGLGSTQTTYAQPPSLASQAAGLGLAGLGLYNLGRG